MVSLWLLSADGRIDRKKDKAERKILDSQERAFWDVHRPVVSNRDGGEVPEQSRNLELSLDEESEHPVSPPPPPPPTARLCQHHRDGHPQVPKGEEPPQGEKGEAYMLLFVQSIFFFFFG